MFNKNVILKISSCVLKEQSTEECASCSVINNTKVLSCKIWWLRRAVKKVWKMVKSQGKAMQKSGNFEIENEWQP